MLICCEGENRYVYNDTESIIDVVADFTLNVNRNFCLVESVDVTPVQSCSDRYAFVFSLPLLDKGAYQMQILQDDVLIIETDFIFQK